MKKIILAAVFVVAVSGFAAAQSTSAKFASKTVKKSSAAPCASKHIVLKQEAAANAKSDSIIKLQLPPFLVADSTAMPVVKNED